MDTLSEIQTRQPNRCNHNPKVHFKTWIQALKHTRESWPEKAFTNFRKHPLPICKVPTSQSPLADVSHAKKSNANESDVFESAFPAFSCTQTAPVAGYVVPSQPTDKKKFLPRISRFYTFRPSKNPIRKPCIFHSPPTSLITQMLEIAYTAMKAQTEHYDCCKYTTKSLGYIQSNPNLYRDTSMCDYT